MHFSPRHEDICWGGGIAPCILNLAIRWSRVVFRAPTALFPGKYPHVLDG
jgi:hypothetical protein